MIPGSGRRPLRIRLAASVCGATLAGSVDLYGGVLTLPSLTRGFHIDYAVGQLVIVAMVAGVAATTGLAPLFAYRMSWRHLYRAALITLVAAALVSGWGPSFAVVVVARAVEGAALGVLAAGGVTALTLHLPARGQRFSMRELLSAQAYTVVAGAAAVTLITLATGWRGFFVVMGIAIAAACTPLLPLLPASPEPVMDPVRRWLALPTGAALLGVSGAVAGAASGNATLARQMVGGALLLGAMAVGLGWIRGRHRTLGVDALTVARNVAAVALVTIVVTATLVAVMVMQVEQNGVFVAGIVMLALAAGSCVDIRGSRFTPRTKGMALDVGVLVLLAGVLLGSAVVEIVAAGVVGIGAASVPSSLSSGALLGTPVGTARGVRDMVSTVRSGALALAIAGGVWIGSRPLETRTTAVGILAAVSAVCLAVVLARFGVLKAPAGATIAQGATSPGISHANGRVTVQGAPPNAASAAKTSAHTHDDTSPTPPRKVPPT